MKKTSIKDKLYSSKYSPFKMLEKEEKRTIYEASHGENKRYLSRDEALIVAIAAMVSIFISLYIRFTYILRFAHFESNDVLNSWNIYAAPLKIIGILLFLFCMHRKGIYYWLIWVSSISAIIYFLVEFFLVGNYVDVSVLTEFVKSIGLYDLPEWIIGQPHT